MTVLITCKNEKDPIKNEGESVDNIKHQFSDARGQVTPHSIVGSG